jgi:hypothetical protein
VAGKNSRTNAVDEDARNADTLLVTGDCLRARVRVGACVHVPIYLIGPSAAVMRAMGLAGSSVNLRDCVVVVDSAAVLAAWDANCASHSSDDGVAGSGSETSAAEDTRGGEVAAVAGERAATPAVTLRLLSPQGFGLSSLGACELFRPWAVCFVSSSAAVAVEPDEDLRAALSAVGVHAVVCPPE